MQKSVTPEFRAHMLAKYPALANNIHYRRMFHYLCFGSFFLDEEGREEQLVISYEKLGALWSKEGSPDFEWRNWNAKENALMPFQRNVLPLFTWNEPQLIDQSWNYSYRTVKALGLDADDLARRDAELIAIGPKVIFECGSVWNKVNKARLRNLEISEYLEDRALFGLNDTQEKIISPLDHNCIDGKSINAKVNENYDYAMSVIDGLTETKKGHLSLDEKKTEQRKLLASIKENSRVLMYPTDFGKTPRLHNGNDCILSLKSEVRKAVCRGWMEGDFSNSQFVIIAHYLEAPISMEFIKTGSNLWQDLNGNRGAVTKEQKRLYKGVIYGICFGTKKDNLEKMLEREDRTDVLHHPIIAELLTYRETWFEQITKDKHVIDLWGNRHDLDEVKWTYNKQKRKSEPVKIRRKDRYGNWGRTKPRWEGSLAATVIQSIEMEIISGAFDLFPTLEKNGEAQVMLFQHDGFCFSMQDKKHSEQIQRRLQKAIIKKANEVGAKLGKDFTAMKLEFEQL